MENSMRNVLFVAKPNSKDSLHLIIKINSYLRSMGVSTFIAEKMEGLELKTPTNESINFCIAVGGDGTMMGAARDWGLKGIPLIGVNLGRVGFLTDIAASSCIEDISKIITGKYTSDKRSVLEIAVHHANKEVERVVAINDFVCRSKTGSLIEFTVMVDNEFVYSQYCDGIIVSTPTGSTAYSVSAGGSIMNPKSKVFSIVPICPQNLSNRPLIVDESSSIKIIYSSLDTFDCFYDGIRMDSIASGSFFELSKNKNEFSIYHNDNYSYYNGLRQKLNWNKN